MKAVILAAGESKRLHPYTIDTPKCLLEIGTKPIINHQIDSLKANGIDEITIVTGFGADKIRNCIGESCDFVHNKNYKETSSIYSLWLAKKNLLGSSFVILNSDVFFHPKIMKKLVSFSREDCITVDYTSILNEEEMKVKVKDGKVADMSKSMKPEDADGENLGLIKFGREGGKELFKLMDELIANGKTNEWAPYAFKELAQYYPLYVVDIGGLPWIEIDFPEDLEKARRKIYEEIKKEEWK